MPRKYPKGSESRLSREGLRGVDLDGQKIKVIFPHGAKRRTRDVTLSDGSTRRVPIPRLVNLLLKEKGYDVDDE